MDKRSFKRGDFENITCYMYISFPYLNEFSICYAIDRFFCLNGSTDYHILRLIFPAITSSLHM